MTTWMYLAFSSNESAFNLIAAPDATSEQRVVNESDIINVLVEDEDSDEIDNGDRVELLRKAQKWLHDSKEHCEAKLEWL